VFHPLERAERLHDGYLRLFEVGGLDVLLVQHDGTPRALEGICPHAGHPFGKSRVKAGQLRCDMHGYLFDLASGACTYYTEGPCRALRTYPCELRDGSVGVLLEAPTSP
jgi:nitrite reductase/ring-hydroxylating ferredoxin subunit